MRYLVFAFFGLLFLSSCKNKHPEVYMFSYFTNKGKDGLHLAYSEDGLSWEAVHDSSFLKPELGKERLMRDPCIILGKDNLFHMVWTVGWNEKGIGYANSPDLINWSKQQYLPVMEHEPNARNCWAPEITLDEQTGFYYIYWATTITGEFPETDSTAENNYNHRLYFRTTPDFKHFSETELFYDAGFNVIDGTIMQREGLYVMFLKDETLRPVPQKNLRVVTSDKITGQFSIPSPPITGNYWAEGPTALYEGGKWIVYFDKYRDHQMGAVQSTDLKNWKDISDNISFPEGTRHGTVFKVPGNVFNKIKNRTK